MPLCGCGSTWPQNWYVSLFSNCLESRESTERLHRTSYIVSRLWPSCCVREMHWIALCSCSVFQTRLVICLQAKAGTAMRSLEVGWRWWTKRSLISSRPTAQSWESRGVASPLRCGPGKNTCETKCFDHIHPCENNSRHVCVCVCVCMRVCECPCIKC